MTETVADISRLIASRTTIPIPKLVACAVANSPDPLSSFLILEYVQGHQIRGADIRDISGEKRKHLYASLADILVQLRRLEFPSIGCLTRSPEGFEVRKKTASLDTNQQELEGFEPSRIQAAYYDDKGLLTSANSYVSMLLEIANNAFVRSRCSIIKEEDGCDKLYLLDRFRQCAEKWVKPSLDQGPFVLVHGDFEFFNLIVNEDMDIVAVLDWEWSRVVPLQFFKPPLWLFGYDTIDLAHNFNWYSYLEECFDDLRAAVRTREQERFGNTLLADEWARVKETEDDSDCWSFLIANALENWTDIDWLADRELDRFHFSDGKTNRKERVQKFMEEDPTRKNLIRRKAEVSKAYTADLYRLKSWKEKLALRIAKVKGWSSVASFPMVALGGAILVTTMTFYLWKRTCNSEIRGWLRTKRWMLASFSHI